MSGSAKQELVLVEFEYQYTGRDGGLVSIKPNERYVLLAKTNDHWWHVRKDEHTKPFYIPAKYVKELPSAWPSPLDFIEPNGPPPAEPPCERMPPDLFGEKPGEVTIHLRSPGTSRKTENRMSTFGIPQDLHDLPYKRSGFAESVITLKPLSGDGSLLVPCLRDPPSLDGGTKRHSLGPAALIGTTEDPQKLHAKPRVPSFSPADPVPSKPAQPESDSPEGKDLGRATGTHKEPEPSALHSPEACSDKSQDSDNIYESIPDFTNPQESTPQEIPPPLPPKSQSENPNTAVYVNVSELRKSASLSSPTDPTPGRHLSSESPEWEVHTDAESGQEFYYNPATGQTTWDSPFLDREAPPEEQPSPSLSPSASPSPTPPASGGQGSEWQKLLDDDSGRYYFYNPVSGETSWEPPEDICPPVHDMEPDRHDDGRPPLPVEDYNEDDSTSLVFPTDYSYSPLKKAIIPRVSIDLEPPAPAGWSVCRDPEGKMLYTSDLTQEQWIRSVDDLGQTYFYTTDGTKSQWNLPELPVTAGLPRFGNGLDQEGTVIKNWRNTMGPAHFSGHEDTKFFPSHRRNVSDYGSDVSSSGNSPELLHHTLEKAGILNKTKVADNGKKLRKNWAQSWTVLHGGILTFNKDPKSQQSGTASKTNQIVPEYTVELRGATISWAGKDKSSKKNVLELKTRHGSEYLIQYDTESIIQDWHKVIMDTIRQLDHGHHSEEEDGDFGGSEKSPGPTDRDEKDKKRAATKPAAPSSAGDAEQKKVRTKLKKFLQKRPTLQSVKERGYIRDQVFGCRLDALCERENVTIPTFVEKCIQAVEKRGLEIDGIYRVSGNLAVIQKLRIKVDQEESLNLEDGQWEDIHVITGALKLFFRELPEPLFPFSHFNNFIAAINIGDNSQKVTYMRDLVRSLPQPNQDTMQELFRHLRRVIERREDNRMSVQSIAIVFGPTLLRPETESANITMYMVFQNQIVEYILNEYDRIFYPS
ncbi:rho GTPase-activating protein 27 isoform X2 [Lepisosteus oculatus]|uniref:rho GTPase-activating protein 27 isoform X2 n=1 Tax=Lepisosteus oculatus TaxID=7918 RepID=UPI0037135E88